MLLALLQAATLVSADTGGIFYAKGRDTLTVSNHTWVSHDSAPKMADCVYSGRSQRMLARDSVHVTIRSRTWIWERTLRAGETVAPEWKAPLVTGIFTLLDISTPQSPCGVNAGEAWFHWRVVPWPPFVGVSPRS